MGPRTGSYTSKMQATFEESHFSINFNSIPSNFSIISLTKVRSKNAKIAGKLNFHTFGGERCFSSETRNLKGVLEREFDLTSCFWAAIFSWRAKITHDITRAKTETTRKNKERKQHMNFAQKRKQRAKEIRTKWPKNHRISVSSPNKQFELFTKI